MTINHASFDASAHLDGAGNEVTDAVVPVSWKSRLFDLVTMGLIPRSGKPRVRYGFGDRLARIA